MRHLLESIDVPLNSSWNVYPATGVGTGVGVGVGVGTAVGLGVGVAVGNGVGVATAHEGCEGLRVQKSAGFAATRTDKINTATIR